MKAETMAWPRLLFCVSAVWCGFAVALGAFGAHGLPGYLEGSAAEVIEKAVHNWETAAKYHLFHGIAGLLAVLTIGIPISQRSIRSVSEKNEIRVAPLSKFFSMAAVLFLVGTFIFSGCLYAMALGAPKFLGAIVPLGGLSMIAGWISFAVGGWRILR